MMKAKQKDQNIFKQKIDYEELPKLHNYVNDAK